MCRSPCNIIMEQIEQQLLLLRHISNDKKYVHVTIPFLLCNRIRLAVCLSVSQSLFEQFAMKG